MARRGGSGVLVSRKINSLFLIMILVIFEFFQFALFLSLFTRSSSKNIILKEYIRLGQVLIIRKLGWDGWSYDVPMIGMSYGLNIIRRNMYYLHYEDK